MKVPATLEKCDAVRPVPACCARGRAHSVARAAAWAVALAVGLAGIPAARAVTIIWSGSASTNWSDPGSWTGGVPGGGDDVKFYDPGATTAGVSNINNFVDPSFAGLIGSLQYGNTNNSHTTLIGPSQTLNVTNTGGLIVGTLTDNGNAQVVNATVTGPGGTLSLSNPAAVIYISQGRSANGNSTQRATLDLSGLGTFTVIANRVDVGTRQPGGANNAQNATGTLKLAQTNILTLAYAPSAYNGAANGTNAIDVGENDGNAGGVDFLYLGLTNAFFLDGLAVGKAKTTATMLFNPVFTNSNPVAWFRGASGPGSRVTFWSIGDMQSSGNSSASANGTNDFSGGTVDAMVNTMSLGRDRNGGNTGSGVTRGTLTFTDGIIDVNTLLVGNQAFSNTGNANPMAGVVNVNGVGATLVVNTVLTLGNTTVASAAAAATSGILNIRSGTVRANAISVGTNSTANNTITLNSGTLIVSNTVGTPAKGLATLTLTNSTLQLNLFGSTTNMVVTNLTTSGTVTINLASAATFSSYPAQVPLIKYYGALGGDGFGAFNLGAAPPNVISAYLSNNTANSSVDLVLPVDPRPVIIAQPQATNDVPGGNDTLTVGISPLSLTPLSYQWYLGSTALTNGPTGSGSTLSGCTAATFGLSNAQAGDSGNYTVVVSNLYGSATSQVAVVSISASDLAPVIAAVTPGNSQTVIAGNSASFTLLASGSPAPAYYWFDNHANLIPSATTATLTLNSVQLAGQGNYSVIVSNRVGVAATNMTLTVIVPPSISAGPQNLVVTNGESASFAVTASGIPAPGYQWLKNGAPITGNPSALTTNLTIAAATPQDIANYSVQVTNAAGSATSSNATLFVNSTTLAVSALSPANGATNLCIDQPLSITFNGPPSQGTTGKILIYNVANPSVPVDTIDLGLALSAQTKSIGGVSYNYYPVMLASNTASIYPHVTLAYGQTYFVIVDDGVFTDNLGAYFAGIADTNTWRFSTRAAAPVAGTNTLVVAGDGSGDFCTVQGAVDFLPANNSQPVVVNVRKGTYTEIVFVNSKNNITFRGAGRKQTIITYPNNANLQVLGGGSTSLRPAFHAAGNDIAMENLTLTNSTPKGGSQAEALRVGGARFILFNADLDSFQDTLLVNAAGNSAYVQDTYIQGDTDFNWGSGTVYMTNCEVKAMSNGYNVQPRNDAVHNGFAFINCRLTKAGTNVNSHYLARGGGNTFNFGQVAYINCSMDNHILPVGWLANGSDTTTLQFWEYQSTDLTGTNLVDVSQRAPWSKQLDAVGAANVQNVTNWFGGWQPQLAPNMITNPASQSVPVGQAVTLLAYATGIPAPAYQWLKNGTNIPGAIAATFTLPSAHASDVGAYSVTVSNAAGTVTSATAILTVTTLSPPAISGPSWVDGRFTLTVHGQAGANYAVQGSTNLVSWQTLFTTNSPALPFSWADPNSGSFAARYYRIVVSPPLP
jgi:pectin methylesterase-like acyl-CoA thioesterase